MHMSHKYESFKNAMKSKFTDRNFLIFAQAVKSHFKNFSLTKFEIKFPIEWYAYYAYFNSRICNIADVLKIERMQLIYNYMLDLHDTSAKYIFCDTDFKKFYQICPIRSLSADFSRLKFCEFLELCENQTICDDVISGR